MYQFTTPTIRIAIPDTLPVGDMTSLVVTLLQGKIRMEKQLSDVQTGAALALATWKPIYVKCAPQTDGSVIIDSTTPYVQDLPTVADGKVYIHIGTVVTATTVELLATHQVYYIDATGRKRVWSGEDIS